MSKKKIADWSCPECGSQVVIYKGWATFKEERIKVENGAKWHCPNCEKMGNWTRNIRNSPHFHFE